MISNKLIGALVVGFMASSSLLALYGLVSTRVTTASNTYWYDTEEIAVVDGDTIRINGHRYRLSGYDTPETFQAQCDSERALGERAKQRLTQLISKHGGITLWVKSRKDQFGRFIANGSVGDIDVGHILISEGLAQPYFVGPRSSWCSPKHKPQNEGNQS
ncbi:thermonuclease family protein [Ruegeria jejuensis]|uniref:thermonuclease family protein n=1 Tax=Ruegeria jejuensis TaxID=3233338 RepID=UPI00355B468E